MPGITSDYDLPKSLNTPAKRVKWVKKLVAQHLGSPSARIDNPPMQGIFSRTLFCTLKDGRELVIQFRTEELGLEAFELAYQTIPDYVPQCQVLPSDELENDGVWVYWMNRMPGKMWLHGVTGKGAEGRIAVNKSLGQVFSNGFIAHDSSDAITKTVRPHLEAVLNAIQSSTLDEALPYQDMLKKAYENLDSFAKLPLWIAHYDINEVNILIDQDCKVTALIDWELSNPLPFGIGFGRIHTIAGEYSGGEFYMPEEFETAERAFWQEMFDGMPADIRAQLQERMDLVQEAVILGTLLNCFVFEGGKVLSGEVGLKALPKFLTYRLPFIRKDEPPYSQ